MVAKFRKGDLEKERLESFKYDIGQQWIVGDIKKFKSGDLRKTKGFELKYWVFSPGEEKNHKPKVQKTVTEMTIILEGRTRGWIGDKKVELKKGEYVLIPPGVKSNLIEKIKGKTVGITIKSPSRPGDDIKL